ncbi:MAG: polysaccharide deacetylase family protein [Solirubrobacteraceae bacterium]|nr:polysaccharide deacetylase family protein [Solirubrobacteraceae bacterium]
MSVPRARRAGPAAGLAAVAGGLLALWLRPPFWAVRIAGRLLPDVLFCVDTPQRAIALTIDDGPDPATTELVLETLARHDAQATFFVLGGRGSDHPRLLQRIVGHGHELGNHTWRAEPSARLQSTELDVSIRDTQRLIEAVAPVGLLRPGSGWVTRRVRAAAHDNDLRCVLGSIYPYDLLFRSKPYIVRYVLGRARPGAIVILHEGPTAGTRIVDVLEAVLPRLRERGYRVTTVSDLVRDGARRADQ